MNTTVPLCLVALVGLTICPAISVSSALMSNVESQFGRNETYILNLEHVKNRQVNPLLSYSDFWAGIMNCDDHNGHKPGYSCWLNDWRKRDDRCRENGNYDWGRYSFSQTIFGGRCYCCYTG